MKRKIKNIRKIKYFLFKNRIHRLLPSSKLIFFGYLSALSEWISQNRKLKYSSFPTKNFDYNKRYNLYQFIIENVITDEEIDFLEFGVAKGNSFRWWIDNVKNKNASFFGFDTFTGLPEDWGPFKKGDMSNGNTTPKINDSRHKFYQGLFQQTLYKFLDSYQIKKRKIIHLDADLYSSTLFVLTSLSPYLRKGDIIIFDEFNVALDEFKAFKEWSDSFYINYSVIGEVNNYYQVAIKID